MSVHPIRITPALFLSRWMIGPYRGLLLCGKPVPVLDARAGNLELRLAAGILVIRRRRARQ